MSTQPHQPPIDASLPADEPDRPPDSPALAAADAAMRALDDSADGPLPQRAALAAQAQAALARLLDEEPAESTDQR